MSAPGSVRLLAPAKLTLSLRVLGVRPDGFHELNSEMVSIDLADELTFDPTGDGLEIVFDQAVGSLSGGPANLVSRALDAVGRRARVRLVKRIPIGGGLGGGSSDAAAVLRWAGCDDVDIAAGLGADVPFCLRGGRARVGGLGERVEPLPDEERSFVLLIPPVAVNTVAVYRAWDGLPASKKHATEAEGNDLTAAALVVAPDLVRWRDRLGELTGTIPRLAGSGATWFADASPAAVGPRQIEVDGQVGRLMTVRTVGPQGPTGQPRG
jgi:4-diphosphocytidyl-2-C-methyl-D-erythritol kinase